MTNGLLKTRLCWVAVAAGGFLIAAYVGFRWLGAALERDEHWYWQEFTFDQAQSEVQRHPESVSAHAVMACHWEDRERWNEAAMEWSATLALGPTDYNVREELADALDRAGRHSEAAEERRRIAVTAPPTTYAAQHAKELIRDGKP